MMAAIVAPVGDCSIAMMRACFERASALWVLDFSTDCGKGFAALTDNGVLAGDDFASDGFLADFDIEILHSARNGAAPPKPRIGEQAGEAGSRSALGAQV